MGRGIERKKEVEKGQRKENKWGENDNHDLASTQGHNINYLVLWIAPLCLGLKITRVSVRALRNCQFRSGDLNGSTDTFCWFR